MESVKKTVFISYRRTNISWALAVFQNLTQHGYDVFLDYDGIASGDFASVIVENIRSRAHFLVLLTPTALKQNSGDATQDWLRREVQTALTAQRNIVPLLLEGFSFSTPIIARELTGPLAELKHYNGLRIHAEYFVEAMERLRSKYLNVPLSTVLHPISASAQKAMTEQQAAAAAAPVVQENELRAYQSVSLGMASAKLDEQLRCLNEAIRLKPDFPLAFFLRGSVHDKKGAWRTSLCDFSESIRLDPNEAIHFFGRGLVRQKKGDLEGALKDLNEGIRLKPNDANAFMVRSRVHRKMGNLADALEDVNEAVRLGPDNNRLLHNRAVLRVEMGDLEGALNDFNEAMRLEPTAITFWERACLYPLLIWKRIF